MQPHLSLEYSSRAGNGLLGVGWQLSGMPKITSCTRTIALDGVSIPVGEGSDWCLGGEHLLLAADGYRLESGDNSTRFIRGDTTITMQLADGSSKVFRLHENGNPIELEDYLLASESDAFGNTVDYTYSAPSSTEYYPATITYSNKNHDTTGQRMIVFNYSGGAATGVRPDWIQAFYRGVEFDIKKTLVGIDCYAPAPPSLAPQKVWSYSLAYSLSSASSRTRLVSVQKVGSNGGVSEKRTFGWNSDAFSGYPIVPGPGVQMTGIPADTYETVRAVDLDGDGRDELLVEQGGAALSMAYTTAPSGFAEQTRLLPDSFLLQNAVMGDLNGDGKMDLIAPVSPSNGHVGNDEEYRLLQWTGDLTIGDFTPSTNFGPYYFKDWNGVVQGSPHSVNVIALADLDGDGLLDMVHGTHFQPPFIPDPMAPNEPEGEQGKVELEPFYPMYFAYKWHLARNTTAAGQAAATFGAESDLPLTIYPYEGLLSPLAGDPHPTFTISKGAGRQRLVFANRWSGYYRLFQTPCLITAGLGIEQHTDGTIATTTNKKSHPQTVYADVNGDGESDTVHYDVRAQQVCVTFGGAPSGTADVCASVPVHDPTVVTATTNICSGDPVTSPPAGPNPPSMPSTEDSGPWHLVAFDMDQDGRDDVVIVHDDDLTNDIVAPESWRVAFTAGHSLDVSFFGRGFMGVGDFDGNGRPDIAMDIGQTMMAVSRAATMTSDALHTVGDSTPTASNTLEYINYNVRFQPDFTTWPDLVWGRQSINSTPVTTQHCTFPQHCIRDEFEVVNNRVVRRGDADAAEETTFYLFSDPREDYQGRGFLGFGVVDEYDQTSMRETVSEYSRVDNLQHSVLTRQTVMTPIVNEVPPPPPTGTVPGPTFPTYPRGTSSRARVVQTAYTYDNCGGSDAAKAEPHCVNGARTDEWEETLSLAQIMSGSVGPQMYGPHGIPRVGDPDAALLRTSIAQYTHDHYANVTSALEFTVGGTQKVTTTTYATPDLTNWLVARPTSTSVADGCADSACTAANDATLAPTPHREDLSWTNASLMQVTVEPTAADPIKETITFVYNADGMATKVTRSSATASRVDSYTYDPAERIFIASHTNALNQIERYLWHPAFGEVVAYGDVNNVATNIQIDELGRMRAVLPTSRLQTHATYQARTNGSVLSGTVATITANDGSSQTIETDAVGHKLFDRHVGFAGVSIAQGFTYDILGRPFTQSRPGWGAPGAGTTQTLLDTLDRPITRTDAAGNKTVFTQSFASTATTDPMGHLRFIFRDVEGRASKSQQYSPVSGIALTTSYRYGNDGMLARVIDPQGHAVAMSYDQRDRRISITTPDSSTTTTTYNAFGDTLSETKAGATSTYTVDALGRMTTMVNADGTSTYNWDGPNGIGLPYTISNADTFQALYYDTAGRHYKDAYVIGGQTLLVQRTLDTMGRVTGLSYPSAPGGAGLSVGYTYNPNGFVSKVARTDSGATTVYWQATSATVDDVADTITWGNGLTGSRIYDAAGRLSEIKDGAVNDLKYTYNADSRIASRIDVPGSRTDNYYYDGLHRLTEWMAIPTASTTRTMFYAYDDLGNLSSEKLGSTTLATYTYGLSAGPHALTGGTVGTITYDTRGRQKTKPGRTITYTEDDLPKTVMNATGTTTFKYDATGSRAYKVAPNGDWTSSIGGLFERRSEGGVVKDIYYVKTPEGVGAQAALNETTLARSLYYLHRDHNGSITTVTATDGTVARRFYFDPWGKRTDANAVPLSVAPDTSILLGFDELRYDDELDLVDQRGRGYDPTLRHFLSADPTVSDVYNGQAFNRFSYIGNDPINHTDPTGFWSDDPNSGGDFSLFPFSDEQNGTSTPNDGGFTSANTSTRFSGAPPTPPEPPSVVPKLPTTAATPSNGSKPASARILRDTSWAANGDYNGVTAGPRTVGPTGEEIVLKILDVSDVLNDQIPSALGVGRVSKAGTNALRTYIQTRNTKPMPAFDALAKAGYDIAYEVLLNDVQKQLVNAVAAWDPSGTSEVDLEHEQMGMGVGGPGGSGGPGGPGGPRFSPGVTNADKGRLWDLVGGICPACGNPMTKGRGPRQMQVDHNEAYSKYGTADPRGGGVTGICATCNGPSNKGSMEFADWVAEVLGIDL